MDKQIRDSAFLVMVCTETYYQRVMGEEILLDYYLTCYNAAT